MAASASFSVPASTSGMESQLTFCTNPANYYMDPTNRIVEVYERSNPRYYTVAQYSDGGEWVVLPNAGKERFCGYLYLDKALKDAGLNHIKATPNKIAIHQGNTICLSKRAPIHQGKTIYLSKYCDGTKVPIKDPLGLQIQTELSGVGFTDTPYNANFRQVGKESVVFDTEKGSFDQKVHPKIDAYLSVHDQIVAELGKKHSDQRTPPQPTP